VCQLPKTLAEAQSDNILLLEALSRLYTAIVTAGLEGITHFGGIGELLKMGCTNSRRAVHPA